MAGMYRMDDLLNLVAHEAGEELRLHPGKPPIMVLKGVSRVVDGSLLSREDVAELFRSIATEEQIRELDKCGDVRFTYTTRDRSRFSVNATTDAQSLGVLLRNLRR